MQELLEKEQAVKDRCTRCYCGREVKTRLTLFLPFHKTNNEILKYIQDFKAVVGVSVSLAPVWVLPAKRAQRRHLSLMR